MVLPAAGKTLHLNQHCTFLGIALTYTPSFASQNAGACKIEDFGVELYTRQIESERQCSATAPGLDSECLPSKHYLQVADSSSTHP